MVTVDTKGRIVIPQELRERLGITPGTDVEVRTEDGKVVVEPEDDPEEIIDRLEQLVTETAPERSDMTSHEEADTLIAQKHRDAIRRGAEQATDE